MPRVDVSRKAAITVVVGSSGTGKSEWLKRELKRLKPRRVLVWDVDEEYAGLPGFKAVRSARELPALLKASAEGRFAFVPPSNECFDLWSLCAFAWGECVAIAEETADVTSPGKAPPGWGTLVRRGRKRGIDLYGVTQRPSESDKTIVGNASRIHLSALSRPQDQKYMAAEMGLPVDQIAALKPLEWIEKTKPAGVVSRGKLRF